MEPVPFAAALPAAQGYGGATHTDGLRTGGQSTVLHYFDNSTLQVSSNNVIETSDMTAPTVAAEVEIPKVSPNAQESLSTINDTSVWTNLDTNLSMSKHGTH